MNYYMNLGTTTNPNANNEVHTSECVRCPSSDTRIYLGYFSNGIDAVAAAKNKGYYKADGCILCCREAHKE